MVSFFYFLNPRLLCVSPPIRQALAGDALERNVRALRIGHAKLGARVVSEIELGNVPLQVLFANMVIRPDQAALQDVEEGFGGIDVGYSASVFALAMSDRRMLTELAADSYVGAGFIGHEVRFRGNLSAQDGRKISGVDVRNLETASLTAALDQGNNLHLLRATSDTTAHFPVALADRVSAPIGLVGFNDLAASAHRFIGAGFHRLADAVRHEPSRLVRDADGAVQLMGAHALLGGAKQVRRQHPLMERNLGILKDRADRNGELATAVATEVKARAVRLAVQGAIALGAATVRAYRAVRPADVLKVLAGGFVVVESGGGKGRISHDCSPVMAELSPYYLRLSSI